MNYKRMWENKGHRPYWAALHVYALTDPLKKITGFSYKSPIFCVSNNASNTAYLNVEEMAAAKTHFAKWWKNQDRYKILLQDNFEKCREIQEKSTKIDFASLKTVEIIDHMKDIANLHGFSFLFVTQPQHVEPLEDELEQLLRSEEVVNHFITYATSSQEPLPFDAEEKEVDAFRKRWSYLTNDERDRVLQNLVEKYGWFGGIEGESNYDTEHYRKEIESTPKERTKYSIIHSEVVKLGTLIASLSNDRIWARYHGMLLRYYIKLSIQELTTRWSQPLLEYATIEEMELFHKMGTLDLSELKKRKQQGYVTTIISGKAVLLTGEQAKPYQVTENISYANELQGRTANPGKVRGNVRIISFISEDYHKQVSQFKQGEILITGMTRPQIAHLCTKAGAIVTDEGGITSHASIISREFNIPCIVGTQDATKVFKTGDLVEVDATNGKILKICREVHLPHKQECDK
jgi:phosphohistidine swiveling domain-containing protein